MPPEALAQAGAGCPPDRLRKSIPNKQDQMPLYAPNVYEQQILAKGRDLEFSPAPAQQFPLTIYGRTFQTKAAYDEALADFLNGI